MGSRDVIKHVVVCSGILFPIIATCIWECTPLISTPDKAMPIIFSYAMKVSKYSDTSYLY